jgi:hypothetical protein
MLAVCVWELDIVCERLDVCVSVWLLVWVALCVCVWVTEGVWVVDAVPEVVWVIDAVPVLLALCVWVND